MHCAEFPELLLYVSAHVPAANKAAVHAAEGGVQKFSQHGRICLNLSITYILYIQRQ